MSLFASVLHLDRRAVRALRITDPYSLHRVVYSLFDDVRSESAKNDGASSGILFADQGGDAADGGVRLIAVAIKRSANELHLHPLHRLRRPDGPLSRHLVGRPGPGRWPGHACLHSADQP